MNSCGAYIASLGAFCGEELYDSVPYGEGSALMPLGSYQCERCQCMDDDDDQATEQELFEADLRASAPTRHELKEIASWGWTL